MLHRALQNPDPLASFRLTTIQLQDQAARPVKPVTLPALMKDLRAVLNIYPLYLDGEFYLVFESIAQGQKAKPACDFIKMQNENSDYPKISVTDADIYFDAEYQGKPVRFCANAYAIYLPHNDFGALMHLAQIMKESAKAAGDVTVVISNASVLQCFQEAICTYQPLVCLEEKERQIVNKLPVPLSTFVYQPEHRLYVDKCQDVLFNALLSLPDSSIYTELASYAQRWKVYGNSIDCLENETKLPFRQLLDDAFSIDQKVDIAQSIDKSLSSNTHTGMARDYLKYLLTAFNRQALLSFVIGFNHHRCSRGNVYCFGSPEISFLLHADFDVMADGRIYIDVAKNKAYQADFADEKPHCEEAVTMLTHLFKCFNLALDRDTDHKQMLIFTDAASRILRANGLHFHERYWDKKLKRRSMLQELLGSSSGLFIAKPESPQSVHTVEHLKLN